MKKCGGLLFLLGFQPLIRIQFFDRQTTRQSKFYQMTDFSASLLANSHLSLCNKDFLVLNNGVPVNKKRRGLSGE